MQSLLDNKSDVDDVEDSIKSCQCDWWNDSAEVCGADGKTYWNSCLAECKTEVINQILSMYLKDVLKLTIEFF